MQGGTAQHLQSQVPRPSPGSGLTRALGRGLSKPRPMYIAPAATAVSFGAALTWWRSGKRRRVRGSYLRVGGLDRAVNGGISLVVVSGLWLFPARRHSEGRHASLSEWQGKVSWRVGHRGRRVRGGGPPRGGDLARLIANGSRPAGRRAALWVDAIDDCRGFVLRPSARGLLRCGDEANGEWLEKGFVYSVLAKPGGQ